MKTDLKNKCYQDEMSQSKPNPECHHDIEETDLHVDKNYSGENILEEGRQSRRHHQEFGNRKYRMFRNHSSADDQPQVFTHWNPGRGRVW
jgi:hypothetical protein